MIQIGVDFGGTKIEAAALDREGAFLSRLRAPNPGAYDAALETVRDLVERVEREAGGRGSVGVGAPGSVSPKTGVVRNANSTWLNGRTFREDLERALGRPVALANDANCLALSEAADGAAAGARIVFAVIIGTGCGGGVVVDGRLVEGANGVGGEWGHTPLPWPKAGEWPGPRCWCGRDGCLETWVSGTGLRRDFAAAAGRELTGEAIVQAARAGDPDAAAAFDRYIDRLGRALAMVCNILDPDVFVFGGGVSNAPELYERLAADGRKIRLFRSLGGEAHAAQVGRFLRRARRRPALVAGAVDLRPRVGLASAIGEERCMGKCCVVWVSAVWRRSRACAAAAVGGAGRLRPLQLRPAVGRRRVRAAARGLGRGLARPGRRRLDDLRLGRAVRDRGGALADRRGGRSVGGRPLPGAGGRPSGRLDALGRGRGGPGARSRAPGASSPPCRTGRACGSTSTVRRSPKGRCRPPRRPRWCVSPRARWPGP